MRTGLRRWGDDNILYYQRIVRHLSPFRAISSTGKAGADTLNNRILTVLLNTWRCTTPMSDRFTISTEWLTTTMRNVFPTFSRSLTMFTTMLLRLLWTVSAKARRRLLKKYEICPYCLLGQFIFLDGKYDRKVAKDIGSCQDNFCWKGQNRDINIVLLAAVLLLAVSGNN